MKIFVLPVLIASIATATPAFAVVVDEYIEEKRGHALYLQYQATKRIENLKDTKSTSLQGGMGVTPSVLSGFQPSSGNAPIDQSKAIPDQSVENKPQKDGNLKIPPRPGTNTGEK